MEAMGRIFGFLGGEDKNGLRKSKAGLNSSRLHNPPPSILSKLIQTTGLQFSV
jgi:hypothetical protein